jgi:hypothetical protein
MAETSETPSASRAALARTLSCAKDFAAPLHIFS